MTRPRRRCWAPLPPAVLLLLLAVVGAVVPAGAAEYFLHGDAPQHGRPGHHRPRDRDWTARGPGTLDTAAPTATVPRVKETVHAGRRGFRPIGTWAAAPASQAQRLEALGALHVWVGLRDRAVFDLRAEVRKNRTVIASGETKRIQGVTRNPDLAKEVVVAFGAIADADFTPGDVLSLKLLAKVADHGGHANAVGLRAYYDASTRPSRFGATLTPVSTLQITITSPAPGTTLPAGTVLVRGTVQAPIDAGVGVNGFPALVNGGQWAVEVPVDTDTASLTATATTMAGDSTTASIPITVVEAAAPRLRLRADRADGVAPLVVTWQVVNQTGHLLVQYELDAGGTGAFGPPTTSFDRMQTTYAGPGLVFPTLRATDDQGTVWLASTVVLVSDAAAVTARFRSLWTGFKARLLAGDAAGALTFLGPDLQARFESVFQQLGAALPGVAAGLGELHVTDQAGDLAEAVVLQEEAAGTALYLLHYRRDGLGRWRIEEM